MNPGALTRSEWRFLISCIGFLVLLMAGALVEVILTMSVDVEWTIYAIVQRQIQAFLIGLPIFIALVITYYYFEKMCQYFQVDTLFKPPTYDPNEAQTPKNVM